LLLSNKEFLRYCTLTICPQINQRRPDEPQQAPEPSGPRDEDFIDTSMARPGKHVAAHRRRRGALEFVEEGSMARQAEIMRLKQKYGEACVRNGFLVVVVVCVCGGGG
jgi:hypothetical protein